MSALDIDISEFVGRSAKLSCIVHGVMNAVEAADGQADPLDELADRIRGAAPLAPLLAQRHWVIWRYEGRNGGKLSKVPHVASNPGRTASSKQSHDWCAFESAIAAAKQHGFDGVSFALTETATTKFAAFDLDDCRNCETGEIVPWAQCLVEEAGSYAEITPSGTGLRIIGYGRADPPVHNKLKAPDGGSCEIYRKTPKFIAVTGDALDGYNREFSNIDATVDNYRRTTPQAPKREDGEAGPAYYSHRTGDMPDWIMESVCHGAEPGKRSEGFFKVVRTLKGHGWGARQIEALLADHPDGIAEKYWNRLRQETDRAYYKLQSGGGPPLHSEPFFTAPDWQEAAPPLPIVLPPCATPYDFPNPEEIPPRAWLHGGHYIRGVVTATIAPGGYGKTTVNLFEAVTMAFNGLRVWYISGEDPKQEIDRRIAAHCLHHRLDRSKMKGALFVDDRATYPLVIATDGGNGTPKFNEDQLTAFEAAVKADRIDVSMLDPFVKFQSAGETNQAFDPIVTRMQRICIAQNCDIEIPHHSRKIAPGQEVTVDDARGGGALVNATRSCRVINRMTVAEAETARVKKSDRTRYLRIDNGKRNMAPPEDAKWMRLVSVHLPNGDNVQAVEFWEFPKAFGEVSMADQDYFRDLVRDGNYRVDSRSPQWLGLELAEKYSRDPKTKGDCTWIATILKTWVENGVFKKVQRYDDKRMKRWFYAPMEAKDEPDDETET